MKNNNPLSPHIQIYNWHVSSLVSISHRISGVINYLFFIFLCIWISFVFLFGQHYNLFADFFNSIFGKFFVISIIWSFLAINFPPVVLPDALLPSAAILNLILFLNFLNLLLPLNFLIF